MPDVNLLVAAHRRDHPAHEQARDELAALTMRPFALSVLAAVGVLRIVTNPRVFPEPTPAEVARAEVARAMAHPNARICTPGERHLELVLELCAAAGATGALVADAQHAALAIECGCTWVTMDRDFERFGAAGLRWRLVECDPRRRSG